MRIYLAGRYSRRLEMCGYRDQLMAAGHVVDAVWLNGEHQISDDGTPIGEHGEALVETSVDPVSGNLHHDDTGAVIYSPLRSGERLSQSDMSERAAQLRQKFAQDDFRDVLMCDLLIAFTEEPRSSPSRGGRHVELGIALGMMKRVWIVGPRENIFCWLDDVRQFDWFAGALEQLRVEGAKP